MSARRAVPLLACALALLAGWALTRDDATPAPPRRAARAAQAPAPAPLDVPAHAAGTVAPSPDLAAAFDGFLGALPVEAPPAPTVGRALARAVAEGQDPVATRLALEAEARRDPAARVALVDALADLPPEGARWALQAAQALAAHADGPATTRLLARLRDAPARNRPFLVLALRGSPDPRADAAFADLYAADADPAVRDAAAFVLGDRAERLDPEVRARALARARTSFTGADPAGWSAAADVLGAPPLAGEDRRLLADALAHDRLPGRRLLALRALAGAGLPAADVRPLLEAVLADPLADEALRAAARGALGRS